MFSKAVCLHFLIQLSDVVIVKVLLSSCGDNDGGICSDNTLFVDDAALAR